LILPGDCFGGKYAASQRHQIRDLLKLTAFGSFESGFGSPVLAFWGCKLMVVLNARLCNNDSKWVGSIQRGQYEVSKLPAYHQ
jgi:hypothetical protein